MRAMIFGFCLALSAAPAWAEDVAALFACLESKDATLVSAHRGGPAPGYPENALETLKRGYARGVRLFEIDVATAKDGALFLMHDRTLDRTTTGAGPVADFEWRRIAALRLKDNDGTLTAFHPPSLAEALAWAVGNDAYLALDFKGETKIEALTAAVREAGAVGRVLYLAGDLDRAKAIAAAQPEAMLSVSLGALLGVEEIAASGLDRERLIVWTGFREFDAFTIALLDAQGFFTSFGTLGFGDSYDDRIEASGHDAVYAGLADVGLHMIATDRPLAARDALLAAGKAWDSAPTCAP